MASKSPIELADLPNEIITAILSLFPTRALLPLTPLSHRIHALILIIIHTRITTLVSCPSSSKQKVILECYHPSAKLSTPYFFCDYLYTEPFSLASPSTSASSSSKLRQLRDLYTHYKPTPPEGDRKVWRPRPAGGWSWVPISDVLGNGGEEGEEFVSQDIYLESHELFSQLMSVVNVVKTGPKKDLFLSCVTVGEGLVRVWRDWLAERAEDFRESEGRDGHREGVEDGKGLLWCSVDKHVGLRLRVLENEDMVRDRGPVLASRDEDPNVGYTLQYEELVVRSTQLLLMIEDSIDRELGNTGKAIVIVS